MDATHGGKDGLVAMTMGLKNGVIKMLKIRVPKKNVKNLKFQRNVGA